MSDHNETVRKITETLKGPVAETFRRLVPSLRAMKAADFYDTVMGNPDLLHGCLLIFRRKTEEFADLLVDAQGRRVNDEFVSLKCGRSVHDIIGMIVRTHAKKHFRTVLGGDPNDPRSPSGKMYAAMNEYLIHEWQVPLVRHYAPLAVDKVLELGPAILDLKDAAALEALIPAKPAEPQLAVDTREHDYWWQTLNDPQVRSVLAITSETDLRELTASLCELGDATRGTLLAGLGLSLYQAAALLGTAHRTMGRAGFAAIFCKPGKPAMVEAFTRQLKTKGLGSRSDLNGLSRAVEPALRVLTPSRAAR